MILAVIALSVNNRPMTSARKPLLVATLALLAAAGAQASCYTVLDGKGQIISQTSTPPVDMSLQLHQTVPERFGPGADMVFGVADENCGPPAEPFEAAQLTPVVHQVGGKRVIRRKPKADRG